MQGSREKGINWSTGMLWEEPLFLKQLTTKEPGKENTKQKMDEEPGRAMP